MATFGTVGDRFDQLAASSGNGEENIDRMILNSTGNAPASQAMRLSYFTSRKTEDITQIYVYTGSIAAAATPTLCQFGLYTEALNGDLTLLASTPNDTTLFAAASTKYAKAFSVGFRKRAGTRYAFASLVVSAVAVPSFLSLTVQNQPEVAVYPRRTGTLAGQATLPGSIANASILNSGMFIYSVLLP